MPDRRIFCIEGAWSSNLTTEESVLPLLTFVRGLTGIPYIHRYVDTPEAFKDLVKRWPQKQYEKHSIGYFGFHGTEGTIHFRHKNKLTLEQVAEALDGRGKGKLMYFGSCSVLNVQNERIEDFLRTSRLRAVCGYRNEVDWFESAAFDLLLFERLINAGSFPVALRQMVEWHQDFVHRLGFKYFLGNS
jgi:hypothetical protein